MKTIQQVCQFLDAFAPTRLAEDWDNVGLLVGDPIGQADRIMTCLTVTPESASEAVARQADLIVTHHPLPFRPLKRLTTQNTPSKLLWELIRAGVSIYSPHTGFDSASKGINQRLAERLELSEIRPLIPMVDDPDSLGAGRFGRLPNHFTLGQLVENIKQQFALEQVQFVGDPGDVVSNVAIACGSGGSFLEQARREACDTFVTGETTFHTCLEARASHISLVLLGHYASERFAVEELAVQLAAEFPQARVWASEKESDPVSWA